MRPNCLQTERNFALSVAGPPSRHFYLSLSPWTETEDFWINKRQDKIIAFYVNHKPHWLLFYNLAEWTTLFWVLDMQAGELCPSMWKRLGLWQWILVYRGFVCSWLFSGSTMRRRVNIPNIVSVTIAMSMQYYVYSLKFSLKYEHRKPDKRLSQINKALICWEIFNHSNSFLADLYL